MPIERDANALGPILTVAVIVKIQQLVAPLGDDSERILEEGNDNQESPDSRQVSTMRRRVSC
jgi:hypothetical protein